MSAESFAVTSLPVDERGVVDSFWLTIPGKPHGQGRARAGNGRVYTPAATREHAAKVQTEWIAAGRPTLPDDVHYEIGIVSYRRRPASHLTVQGTLNATGKRVRFPGKPDLDNEIKQILDALVGCGAIPDDRMCVDLVARKQWLSLLDDQGERVTVRVSPA